MLSQTSHGDCPESQRYTSSCGVISKNIDAQSVPVFFDLPLGGL